VAANRVGRRHWLRAARSSLFGVATFLLLPMLAVFWLSLHRWDLLGPIRYVDWTIGTRCSPIGPLRPSLIRDVTFIALVVPVQTVLGLIAAAMLARGCPAPGSSARVRVAVDLRTLAIAVLWRWILAPTDGAVSTLLGHRVEWLTDPGLALPVVSAVVVWTTSAT